jgi:CheY-like chemotaxis protein
MDSHGRTQQFVMRPREGAASPDSSARPSSDGGVSKPTVPPASILVVEDQEDVRRMVATALEIEGYQVDEAANAHEGLRKLRERTYELVLTDYAMPGGTGTWMLQEASRQDLIRQSVAVIVTAHPDVREFANVPVINKPLDLDHFLEQVRKIAPSSRGRGLTPAPDPPQKVELVLYISSTSPASLEARQNLDELLTGFDKSKVKCTVIDLVRNPLAGDQDHISFTPTLVKRAPGPRTWILGNLRDKDVLADILQASGIPRTDVA